MYDAFGNEIKIGAYVVYNLSGNLAAGKVIHMLEKYSKRCCNNTKYFSGYVDIEPMDGVYPKLVNGYSRVRNLNGIRVLAYT